MADLNMANYFIVAIKWQPHANAPLDRVGFGRDQEEQNEAIETLIGLLMMEERSEDHEEESMTTTTSGPKRMEVELKQINSPTVVRKVVVTTVMPPKEHFKNYMLGGRIYKACGTLEKFKSAGMSSDMWKITEIKQYAGGFSSPATTYYGAISIERQDAAWDKVVTFLEGLQPSELNVINNWEVTATPGKDDDDDESDMYGYGLATGHYTNRVPHHYQQSSYKPPPPPVAMLRTAGDEVGELLHLDTCELEVQRPDGEREMDILEYLEKKDEAETEEENPEAEVSASVEAGSKPSGAGGSSSNGSNSSIVFCDCGSPSCTTCEEIAEFDAMHGAYGYTLH